MKSQQEKRNQEKSKKSALSKNKPKPSQEHQPQSNPGTSKPDNNSNGWSDPKFNESALTMSQLQDMIKTLAEQVYAKKYEDLKSDMEEEVEWRVTSQCEEIEETVDNLKKELAAVKKDKEELKEENQKLKRQVERCEFKLSRFKTKQLKDLEIKLDAVEQRCFENDVQIVGAPELPEDLGDNEEEEKQIIVKLAKEKMNIALKKSNIEKIHRLGKKKPGKTRD